MPEFEKQYWLDLADDYRDEFKRRFPSFQYRARVKETPEATRSVVQGGSRKRRSSDPEDVEEQERKMARPTLTGRTFSSASVSNQAWWSSTDVSPYTAGGYMDMSPGVDPLTRREDYFSMPHVGLAPPRVDHRGGGFHCVSR